MNRKIITVATSIAVPLVFIFTLYILNPIVSFLKLNKNYNQIALAFIGILLATTISYLFDKSTKQILKPNKVTLKKMGIGFLLGILATFIMIGVLLIFSELKLEYKNTNYFNTLLWCLIFFPLAYMEEIIFRGTLFFKLKNTIGLRTTQLIFALLFAFYHDPTGTTLKTQILGPGVWALVYGWAAIKSGGIAFPTGIHAGINIVQALFGMKEDTYALFNFYYDDNTPLQLQNKTETIGLIMQLIVLIVGIYLTEKLIRNKKRNVK